MRGKGGGGGVGGERGMVGGGWAGKTVTQPPHQPTQPPVCHLLGSASRSTGRSGRQKAATRRSTRREERVTVQGPVKRPQPDAPHAHRNTARQVVDDRNAEGSAQQTPRSEPAPTSTAPGAPTTGRRRRGNNATKGAPAAAADRKQRPEATCGGKNG